MILVFKLGIEEFEVQFHSYTINRINLILESWKHFNVIPTSVSF